MAGKSSDLTPEQLAWLKQAKNDGTLASMSGSRAPNTGKQIVWDPSKQSYTTQEVREMQDPTSGWYFNSQDEYVFGKNPLHAYRDEDGNMRSGINPYISVAPPPVAGMGDDGYQTLPEGWTREEDGSATNPEGVNNLTPNQDIIDWNKNPIGPPPVGSGSGYDGSEGYHSPGIGDYYYGPNNKFGQGGGAIGGGDGGWFGAAPEVDKTPLQGYESSSNRDFYQRQFANMNDQQNQQAAMADAIRNQAPAEQGPAFGGDPWSWTDLPSTVQGGGNPDGDPNYDPNAWILNPSYGFESGTTTHADIVRKLGGLRGFTDDDRNWFGDLLAENPSMEENTLWARDRDQALNQVATGGLSPDAQQRVNSLLNNVWIQQGDAPTAGGMNVPAGYASPTNM